MEREYFSPTEIAEKLGVHRVTVYRRIMNAVYSGSIKSFKIGRLRRISWPSVVSWLEDQDDDREAA